MMQQIKRSMSPCEVFTSTERCFFSLSMGAVLEFGGGDILTVSSGVPSVTSLCFSHIVDMPKERLRQGQQGSSCVAMRLLKLLGKEGGGFLLALGSWLNISPSEEWHGCE